MWVKLKDKEGTRVNLNNINFFRPDLANSRILFYQDSSTMVCVYDDENALRQDVTRIENITNTSVSI